MSTPIKPPTQKHVPQDAILELQMAQSDVRGKIHCGLDNQVSVNRKQNDGSQKAVFTAYTEEFLQELLPYPKLLISYR
jgi:hypothetical protein